MIFWPETLVCVTSCFEWGGVGAGTRLLAGLLTPFPGLALGMAIMGGVTGAALGNPLGGAL